MYAQKQRHYADKITYTSVADGRERKIRNGLRIAYKSYFKNPSLGKKLAKGSKKVVLSEDKKTENGSDYIIIGAAIVDVLAQLVDSRVFAQGSVPAQRIAMHTGGDAMNEACVLAGLGASVRLVGKVGQDAAGDYVLRQCQEYRIGTEFLNRDPSIDTGVNIVLVDGEGERHFITSPNGSLRRLCLEDVPKEALEGGKYLCFASIFVAPAFDHLALQSLFKRAKEQGLILCADMTKCKNGETIEDMRECLSLLDYIFPNYEEACLLTGRSGRDEAADAFLACGVGHVVLKDGARGCLIKTTEERYEIPAYPSAECIDTTGAGDTFTACFLYALGQGMTLPECGRFANAGASICIEQLGAVGGIQDKDAVMERYFREQCT